jgi:tetratricopeptide (TPR) repeat protein
MNQLAAFLLAVVLSVLCATAGSAADFVGAAACVGCHAEDTAAWRGSQHDQAMQEATPATVLGDFSGASFAKDGVTSRFYRKGDRYFVETDGPDGALHEYAIDYTFGVYPLQQYLVAFPGGRWQALPLAWDTRPEEQGGQRWFHLYPDEKIPAGDELHWTGINQNWNWMCADCHSTDLRRNYDLATDSYHTSFAALNVACEACHGPGSAHVAWAQGGADPADPAKGLDVLLHDRGEGLWRFPEGARIAQRMTPLATRTETEVCAPCHARRSPLGDGHRIGQPLLDGYRLSLLDPQLYHADGRIDGEVFIQGSFLQSRMYAAGVTCSDCHEPHSLKLHAEGNALCSQCHLPAAFDVAAHHHHPEGGPGSRCVDCHMPATTYMVVDPRHDHGFRVPRPDLAARTGAPDACTGCHGDRDAAWAAARVAEWYGPERRREPGFAEALQAGRTGAPGAGLRLAKLAGDPAMPGIVRATAVAALEQRIEPATLPAVQKALADPDPLVRLAAAAAMDGVEPAQRLPLVPLLDDPVAAVRLDAARVLAPVDTLALPAEQRAKLDAGFAAYEAAQKQLLDRPEGLITLANFYRERGRLPEAEARFLDSIRLHPGFVPAYANLADLLRQQERDAEGARILAQGLAVAPDSADLHHSQGLLLIRQQRYGEAVTALGKAATLAPGNPRYAYVYAVALQETGRAGEVVGVLEAAVARNPNDPELLFTLAATLLQQGDVARARRHAQALVRVAPGYPNAQELLRATGPG